MSVLARSLEFLDHDRFCPVTEIFNTLINSLKIKETITMTASELEKLLKEKFQNMARATLEAKLNMIGALEAETIVKGSDGTALPQKKLVERTIATIFGNVTYKRWGYSADKGPRLFPADGHLNLPPEKYTHEIRRLVSEDITRSSYDETLELLSRRSAVTVPKRQGIELVDRGAQDFVDFYNNQLNTPEDSDVPAKETGSLLILTTDGKGVVMRHESLREATRKAAEKEQHKLQKRLTAGEKKDRKRMAQVASVYTIAPHVRTAEEITGITPVLAEKKKQRPRPEDKRVWASVEREAEHVIAEIFQEGQMRDPHHEKQWVALVDGNKKQLRVMEEQAKILDVTLTIIIDIIHVVEYLWKASHAFYQEGDPLCEQFVTKRLLLLLQGQSNQVANEIQAQASEATLTKAKQDTINTCVSYLLKYQKYLHYDIYLAQGLPIATGVIEGACRYLVKDRMDITGARWGLTGAEAVLRLRSLRVSGDFDEYWSYHEKKEQERNHSSKYENGLPLLAENNSVNAHPKNRGQLHLVKG